MSVEQQISERRRTIPWAALAAGSALSAGIAIVANVLIRAIFLAAFDISDDFDPLASVAMIFPATIIGVGLAALVFALIIRMRSQPVRDFQIVALAALALSALPIIGEWSSNDAAGGAAISALALMHIATAAAVLVVLVPFVRRRLSTES